MPPILTTGGFPKVRVAKGELGREAGEGRGEGILGDFGDRERTGERVRGEATVVDCFAAAPEIALVVAAWRLIQAMAVR